MLQFAAHDAHWLRLGQSKTAVEGQKVVAIGNPEGLQGTVSDGLITAFRHNRSMIQITAPISGSSGSPALDESGQVIGVATLIERDGQNLNTPIPVESVAAAISSSLAQQAAGQPVLETPKEPAAGVSSPSNPIWVYFNPGAAAPARLVERV